MRPIRLFYVTCLATVALPRVPALAAPATKIYWGQTFDESLRRADVAGTNPESVVPAPSVADPVAVGVDALAGKLYWLEARNFDDKLMRSNINGTGLEPLVLWPNVASPTDLAVDAVSGKLYWSEDDSATDSNDRIVWANLDGSNAQTIISWPVLLNPAALAIDPVGGKLYWIQRLSADDQVMRSNLDGTASEEIVAWPAVADPTSIAVDPLGAKVYWSQASATEDRIVRANLNGSDVATVVSSPLVIAPVALAVDAIAGKMFWAEDKTVGDRIVRAELNGTSPQTVVTFLDVGDPVALALDGTLADQPPILTADAAGFTKNRFASLSVVGGATMQSAIRITLVNLPGPFAAWNNSQLWINAPTSICELGGIGPGQPCPSGSPTSTFARLRCTPECRSDWSRLGPIHIRHEGMIPGAAYRAEVIDCSTDMNDPANYQSPLDIATPRWGDVGGPFVGGQWTAPNNSVDVTTDVVAVLEKFASRPSAPIKARADVEPSCVDMKINISDVTQVLQAFRSLPYPYTPSVAGPCASTCP